jgi:hypothetical protein
MTDVSNERARQFAAVYEATYPAVYAYAARGSGVMLLMRSRLRRF